MPTVELQQSWHGYPVAIGSFDLSDEGARVLKGNADNIYSIDDATERFMDEIDYWQGKITEATVSQTELMREALRNPLAQDYDLKFQELRWGLEFYTQVKTALERDLGELLGREPEW